MPSNDVMLKIAKMKFLPPVKTNEEIAEILVADRVLKSPNTKKVKELIEKTGEWLIDEQQKLETFRANDNSEEKSLAKKLCETFGLLDARVVPGGKPMRKGYASLARHTAAAAEYIDEAINELEDTDEGAHVLVSGGETILQIVSSLPERGRPGTTFYSAAITERGRKTMAVAHIGPETNTTIAWSRSGKFPLRLCYGTAAPYEIDEDRFHAMKTNERHKYICEQINREITQLCDNQSIRDILDDTDENVNFAIAGLGLLKPTELDTQSGGDYAHRISMNYLLHRYGVDLDTLQKQGAIGDINYAMFDANGKGRPEWRFFITPGEGTDHLGPSFYRRMVERNQKVVVTLGARKESLILPAMQAKLFNVLITDAYTAQRLLA